MSEEPTFPDFPAEPPSTDGAPAGSMYRTPVSSDQLSPSAAPLPDPVPAVDPDAVTLRIPGSPVADLSDPRSAPTWAGLTADAAPEADTYATAEPPTITDYRAPVVPSATEYTPPDALSAPSAVEYAAPVAPPAPEYTAPDALSAPSAETPQSDSPMWPAPEARDPNAVTLRMPPVAAAPAAPSYAAPAAPEYTTPAFSAPAAAPAGAATMTMPTSPPVAPSMSAPSAPATNPAKKRSFGKWLLFGVLGLGLLAGGFFVGNQLRADDPATEPQIAAGDGTTDTTTSAVDSPVNESETDTTSGTTTTVPLVVQNVGDEPIVAVAAALSPSVVSIADNFGGFGSGIVYDLDGNIVTNAHVVGDATSVTVVLSTGERIEGTVVGADAETDVAVVHVDARSDIVPAIYANSSAVQVGQMAVAIGSPFGLTQTVTAGIVSASSRPVDAGDVAQLNSVVPMIQTDAPINPGNSGGALADRNGHVIGMNTLIRTTSGSASAGNIGVGFAIPTSIFSLIADGIIAGEPVTPSVFGVTGNDPGIGEQPGARIVSVTAAGAADLAGLQEDDLVVLFDGITITSMGDLAAFVRLTPAGTPIPVKVIRDGLPLDLTVELQSR